MIGSQIALLEIHFQVFGKERQLDFPDRDASDLMFRCRRNAL